MCVFVGLKRSFGETAFELLGKKDMQHEQIAPFDDVKLSLKLDLRQVCVGLSWELIYS